MSLAITLVVSMVRRSPGPLVFVAATSLLAVSSVLVTKRAMGHVDPSVTLVHSIAFPSGHMVGAIVFSGQWSCWPDVPTSRSGCRPLRWGL